MNYYPTGKKAKQSRTEQILAMDYLLTNTADPESFRRFREKIVRGKSRDLKIVRSSDHIRADSKENN